MITIRPAKGENLAFNVAITTESYTLLKTVPGFHKWDGRLFLFRPTPTNVDFMVKHFPDVPWIEGAEEHLAVLKARDAEANKTRALKAAISGDESDRDDHEYKLEPWKHQRKAFLLNREQKAFALLMEQRTGKTKVIIDTASWLFRKERIHTLVVVSVNGVHRNWVDTELPKHMPDWCNYKAWFSRSSTAQKYHLQFLETGAFTGGLRIFAFHVEGFSRAGRMAEYFHEAITSMNPEGVMLVMDESTRIKNRSSGRSKFLFDYAGTAADNQKAGYRRILTGTPQVKDPLDWFGQFWFLDPNILGLDTQTAFKARYCETKTFERGMDGKMHLVGENSPRRSGDRFSSIVGVRHADELSKLVDGYSFRVLRRDCADLPPKVYKRYPVELTPAQRRLYKQLRDEYIAEFKGQTVTAAMAMVRAIRLQQVICNWWPMSEDTLIGGETWKSVQPISKENPRLDALDNIVASADSKVLIWARFRPDLEMIQKHFGKRAVSYHGGIKDEQKAANLRRFKFDKTCDLFIGNPASAGLGLDLSMADISAYYSNSYKLEDRLQSEDRTESMVQKTSTLIWDLEAPGTQDSKIIANLKQKKFLADIITKDPAGFFMDTEDD